MGKKLNELANSFVVTSSQQARLKTRIKEYAEEYARLALEAAAMSATVRIVNEQIPDHPDEKFEQGYWDGEKTLFVEPNRNAIRTQKLPKLP